MTDVLLRCPGATFQSNEEYSHVVEVIFDNLTNLAIAQEALTSCNRLTVIGLETNRHFKRVLWEIAPYVRVGTNVRIVVRDSEFLSWFGLKALVREIYGTAWIHSRTEPRCDGYKSVEFLVATDAVRGRLGDWSVGVLTNDVNRKYLDDVLFSINLAAETCGVNVEFLLFESNKKSYEDLGRAGEGGSGFRLLSTDWAEGSDNISAKKNVICEQATHDNIVVMHDRYLLGHRFFQAFSDIGHNFDIAVPEVLLASGKRGLDWAAVSSSNYTWSSGGLLSYRDSSRFAYCPGGITVIRREVWSAFPWNDACAWNEHEDVELSRRFQRSGGVLRFVQAPVVGLRDRWVDQNVVLPLDNYVDVLPAPPSGDSRIRFVL
jgi:hypothetical protein